jgi:3-oxoacyl-[acyl-carrier-protein] synthase II
MNRTRVVVTGVGVISANGQDRETFWENVVAGKQSIDRIELFDTLWTDCKIAGEIKNFDASKHLGASADGLNRSAQFALIAARAALQQSELDLAVLDPYRVGLVVGTCQGTLPELRVDQVHYPPLDFMHSSCDAVAHQLVLKGPRAVISNACAAGANAVGLARDKIWSGDADVMLAGGTDALTFFSLAGFSSLQSLDVQPCSPYGRSSGLTLGEGAAVLVLEPLERAHARGATILAELRGYGLSADAYHPTAPDPSGRGAALAMGRALDQAGISSGEVSYVNGHGTGTQANDLMERKAFRTVFGARAKAVPVSSTKSMVGHGLGAAGAIEAVTCVLACERDMLPPTANQPAVRDNDDFDFVPGQGRSADVDVVMSNSYAFGGSNASLVFAKPVDEVSVPTVADVPGVSIIGLGAAGSLGVGIEDWWRRLSDRTSAIHPIERFNRTPYRCQQAAEGAVLPKRGFAASGAWRKMDRFERMCVASARLAWADAGLDLPARELERVAVIFATSNGSFETMVTFERAARISQAEANPALFPHTALNAAGGHICTTLGLRGPTSTITAGGVSGLSALIYAADLIRQGEVDRALAVGADQFCEQLLQMLDPWPGLLTSGPVRPFDDQVDGTALGEASVTVVLERQDLTESRGGRSYGEVLGHGMTGDASTLGGFNPSGEEWTQAMKLAIERSDLRPTDIGFAAAAASGLVDFDAAEAKALANTFPAGVRVGTSKEITGECLAASGLINLLTCLLALNRDETESWSGPDLSTRSADRPRAALANSASLGGNYVSVVVGRSDTRPPR